ncbi:MAG: TetR/AcrR family transcriptional regulator, partial [Flavobacteriaceae bacterium]|nr:TetR/AcrR family transcriptional regulator [Flavobacteriaceae bacterium]
MKKLGVKDRIIETASDLFYNAGYNQTGINQIIAEAGVAKASMYQHF